MSMSDYGVNYRLRIHFARACHLFSYMFHVIRRSFQVEKIILEVSP
jgi:hypothetical protein